MSEGRQAPRYTGVRTFAGLAHMPLEQLGAGAQAPEVAVVGVPFDTATSWRAGARFAPEAIRSASVMLRPFHAVHGLDVFGSRAVLDAGDVAVTPGNAERSSEQIAAALGGLCASGAIPLVLGGDHSIALGELRAHASVHGPLALILLDAHADTWEDYYGERLFHGTVLRRAAEEGLLDPARSLIAGIRGALYGPSDLKQAQALGFELVTIAELRASEPATFAARVSERIAGGAAFLGFDIDAIDPSAAPATGTPEVGGCWLGRHWRCYARWRARALWALTWSRSARRMTTPLRSPRCWRPTSPMRCSPWRRSDVRVGARAQLPCAACAPAWRPPRGRWGTLREPVA